MITLFKYSKTIAIGNIDKRHQYETESFEAVSDKSFAEAKEEVLDQVTKRTKELLVIKNMVDETIQVKTNE